MNFAKVTSLIKLKMKSCHYCDKDVLFAKYGPSGKWTKNLFYVCGDCKNDILQSRTHSCTLSPESDAALDRYELDACSLHTISSSEAP